MTRPLDATERRLSDLLSLIAVLHIVSGLALPLLLPSWPALIAAMPANAGFWAAVFGPTVASWGVLMFVLVRHGLRARQRWACDALLLALMVWAPLDSLLCWRAGFPAAIALNAVAAASIAVPLWMLRRHWASPSTTSRSESAGVSP